MPLEPYDLSDASGRVVGKVLSHQARQRGERVWLVSDDRRVTFAEADALVNRIARGLRSLGVVPGEPVTMLVEPSIDAVLLSMAITRLGGFFITISTDFHGAFLEDALRSSAGCLLIVDAAYVERVAALGQIDPVAAWVINGAADPAFPGASALGDLLAFPADPVDEGATWQDTVQVWWSSGTTGKPKGVMHSHSSVLLQATGYDREYEEDEVLYSCTPFYLGSPWSGTIWTSLVFGVTAAIDTRFSVSGFWDRVRLYEATQAYTLGAMHMLLWKQPPDPQDRDHRLRRFVAIPMPAELIPEFKARFNIASMSQGYGTSETFRIFDAPDSELEGAGARLGRPVAHYDVALLGENDLPVAEGEVGEVCVRPHDPGRLFLGYFGEPGRTVESWRSLWHHTGDMARKTEDGVFHFADRKKDYIRLKGRNLSMFEVEAIIEAHPAVAEVAAFGVTSELLDTEAELMVCIVRKPGCDVTAEDIARHVNRNAPYYFVPRFLDFVPELARNAHGRTPKEALRARGVTAGTWDREKVGFRVER
ncbi:MAG: putative fatty acid CoA ligase [Phenylobacterium sp.]|uniref:AMP-binding protein n=1 Tax=Phenylobacterium sp. TaxID=1871053 RepID=UPI00263945C2|nr:AMP-binding protein [Phenylobacterium sp.]MDB5497306.1 putative fatty acid CoA ligase [Phenylobacterium sp.]